MSEQVPSKDQLPWRCFHCDEVCTDHESALEHFGMDRHCIPICKVDRAEYRRMEKRNIEHTLEDTELHRALEAKSAEMITAVRKAEEDGYNKGLADGRGLAPEPAVNPYALAANIHDILCRCLSVVLESRLRRSALCAQTTIPSKEDLTDLAHLTKLRDDIYDVTGLPRPSLTKSGDAT